MPGFEDLYGLKGAVISGVDLINGIGVYAGMDVVRVEGATGLYNTNYEGKVYVAIYNMLGQQLGFKFAQNENGTYKMNLNLSSAATGVYLVRVGGQNTTTYKTGRVIVK